MASSSPLTVGWLGMHALGNCIELANQKHNKNAEKIDSLTGLEAFFIAEVYPPVLYTMIIRIISNMLKVMMK